MRRLEPLLFILLLLSAGCGGGGGGGGGGGEDEGVVLAVWPVSFDGGSSDPFDAVDIGFTSQQVSFSFEEPVVLAASVTDGAVGLYPPVDASDGGAPFLVQVGKLTDGIDTLLGVSQEREGPGGPVQVIQSGTESTTLVASVLADPDLAGFVVTAFQLELTVVEIGPSTTPPPELRANGSTHITFPGTDARIEGVIRILGIPPAE